jgi:hypothetical protein
MRSAIAVMARFVPLVLLSACTHTQPAASHAPGAVPLSPTRGAGEPGEVFTRVARAVEPLEVRGTGDRGVQTTAAQIIDTGRHLVDAARFDVAPDVVRRVREILPAHTTPPLPQADANAPADLQALPETFAGVVTHPEALWVGVTQTAWNPPDPTLAVGPNHVVVTVNQSIAFYNRAGVRSYINDLGSPGNPGFFEELGSGNFCFDPKCFFDHYTQRFVVLALETYNNNEAYITIAVSDDADPNGTWYKYRTDAVISASGVTYWWDYPGLGFDQDAFYVTGNLYGLNQDGWGAAAWRIFPKTPMLTGAAVTHTTLRDTSSASVQVAQHFGGNAPAAYFVSFANSASLRVHAVRNALTTPTLTSTTVAVPAFAGTISSPTPAGATELGMIDNRMMNACWRNGKLYAAHTISAAGKNVARWYQINTNTWPTSGGITLAQSGNVNPGADIHSFFPAIYANASDQVAMVLGISSPRDNVAVAVTGRRPTDPIGTMAQPLVIKPGEVPQGGRWGDYYDIAMDPLNDSTFWVIGEYRRSNGWANWVASFSVGDLATLQAVPDGAGAVPGGASRRIDVLANDSHRDGLAFSINSFQATSQRGGSVSLSVGTGPGGRNELLYTAPTGINAPDSFTYTLRDSSNAVATAAVYADIFDVTTFRNPDATSGALAGVNASYYDLTAPQTLPDFSTLTPFLSTTLTNLNIPSTGGVFSNSTRSDNVGAVFTTFVRVPTDDIYTFSTESDDGSDLSIGSTRVVNNDGLHGMVVSSGSIGLKAGLHRMQVRFFEAGGGAGLIVRRRSSAGTDAIIPSSDFFRTVVPTCDSIDFNADSLFPDDQDLIDFLSVLAGGPCSTNNCNDIDFNNDGLFPDDNDLIAFLRVLAGGNC